MKISSSSIDEACKDFNEAGAKETHVVEVVTQEFSATEGNLASSFFLVSTGDYGFNIVSFVGVAGGDEVYFVRVDEYAGLGHYTGVI